MRGDLAQTSAADLCRRLADEGATGTLTIHHPDGEGRVRLRAGAIHSADSPAPRARLGDRLVNAALLSQDELLTALEAQAASAEHVKLGAILVERDLVTRDVIRVFVQEQILDALFEITGWSDGTYEFTATPAPQDRLPVELSVDQTMVEIARRQSEWDQLQRRIPSLDMIPDFVTGGSTAAASLEPDEFAVLASVDGQRSIRELAADLGYSEFEAARIVYGLALLGIVDVQRDDEPEADTGDDLEVDLDVPADVAPEPTVGIDVAAALEEALAAAGRDPATAAQEPPATSDERPPVRIHGGEGGFQWDALDGPVEDQRTPPPPEPRTDDDLSSALRDVLGATDAARAGLEEAATPDTDEAAAPDAPSDGGSLTDDAGNVDEDDAWSREELDDESSSDEPEVFVLREEDLEDEPPRAPASGDGGFGFFAGPADPADGDPTPDTAAPPDEPAGGGPETPAPAASDPGASDDDFDRLLDELAGTGDDGPGRGHPYTSTPTEHEPAAPADRAPSDRDEERDDRLGGDVSEFLRELSRLAVDEPTGGTGGDRDEDDDRSDAARAADAAADAKTTPPRPREDDDKSKKKKGGLFGWGR